MQRGKSLLFRALAARERRLRRKTIQQPDAVRTYVVHRRREPPLTSSIVRARVSRRCPHISARSSAARARIKSRGALTRARVWAQRDINRTRVR